MGPLEDQEVLLTTETSLQLLHIYVLNNIKLSGMKRRSVTDKKPSDSITEESHSVNKEQSPLPLSQFVGILEHMKEKYLKIFE